jgi:hypothetical protein
MKVQQLLKQEEDWCKGTLARDTDGFSVGLFDKEAVKFCLLGALLLCYNRYEFDMRIRGKVSTVVNRLYKEISLSIFNDDPYTTFAMIRKVIEEADV